MEVDRSKADENIILPRVTYERSCAEASPIRDAFDYFDLLSTAPGVLCWKARPELVRFCEHNGQRRVVVQPEVSSMKEILVYQHVRMHLTHHI